MIRRRDWAVPLVAGVGYAALGLFWLRFVYLSDFFQMIWLADAQRAGIGSAWANGFLGFGYPALLNLVTVATGNILTSGKLIQIVSGVALLLMLPWAARRLFGDHKGALVAQALLAVETIFVFAAAGETPDLLATALMFPGLVLAVDAAQRDSQRSAGVAGVLLGLAYLVRYHALLLVCALVVTLVIARVTRRTLLCLVAGFVAASLPQMVLSGLIQGAPLFNLHVKSIALGYYGTTSDFVRHTEPWTFWTIVSTAPVAVAKQYLVHVDRYFTAIGGTVFGLAGLLLARRNEGRPVALLAGPLMLLVLGLAMKFYTDRAILLPLVAWYLVVGRALAAATAEASIARASAVALLAAAIAFSSVLESGRRASRIRNLKQVNDAVTRTLRAHDVADSRAVFSTHLSYYLADDPRGGAFHPHDTWLLYDPNYAREFPHASFTDIASLTAFVEREGIRFLLLGPLTGELAPPVLAAQRSGSLGADYELLGRWPDLYLFEYVPARSRPGRVQGVR
jgi:Dolichyl-phosphate-mannose-protein mannosyltransferase